ncbi:maf-like protein DDB_G0281937 isoform X1 [Solanum pennellii]|uniref:Maf-like protein DDB_G0281937 isoform X1 n=1 Tax=Solanum pennellii TaxID=28526 RepID=A0ABM1GI03_SOLPN|nr:maf-like protein DDB_G0281937 isoform X1 [Solanum pennellii]
MEANAPQFKLILGSSSTARKKILGDMGYEFTTMSADIDEKAIRKEKPEDLVMALAEAKADAIISKFRKTENPEKVLNPTILVAADTAEAIIPRVSIGESEGDAESTLLITCDQVVVYEGVIREKPSSEAEARQFMKDYANGQAATVSSVLVTNLTTGSRRGEWDKVEIYFHDIPDQVIDKLIEEGIVLYAAGGLIIEHPLVLPYIKEVVGSTDSVMGLPKALTERLIKEVL